MTTRFRKLERKILMTDIDVVLAALDSPRHRLLLSLPGIPAKPGLYAIYGGGEVWAELGLGAAVRGLPLYVGKAEDSLASRDLRTHFGDGRTGSSTVRRSFAALLRDSLQLSGVPRNTAKPGHFSNFGLSPQDDAKLTAWMRERLEIAVWLSDFSRPLLDVERDVLQRLNPPINILGVNHKWKSRLQAKRAIMADQARTWRAQP